MQKYLTLKSILITTGIILVGFVCYQALRVVASPPVCGFHNDDVDYDCSCLGVQDGDDFVTFCYGYTTTPLCYNEEMNMSPIPVPHPCTE